MTGFLSTFSKPFQLAVLLWPFVAVLLTVPAAVYLYHRDNRLRPASVLGAYSFMLYVLGLGCFILYPWPRDSAAYCATHHLGAQLNPLQFIGDIRADGVTAILQLGMNIVSFVPMGFFLTRFFRLPSWVAAAVCCATSVCIEVAQLTGIFHSIRAHTVSATSTMSSPIRSAAPLAWRWACGATAHSPHRTSTRRR